LPPTSFRSLRSIRTGSCEPSLTQVIAEIREAMPHN